MIEEEDKLGRRMERLDRVERSRSNGYDVRPTEQVLRNMRALNRVYDDYRQAITDGLNRCRFVERGNSRSRGVANDQTRPTRLPAGFGAENRVVVSLLDEVARCAKRVTLAGENMRKTARHSEAEGQC